MLKEKYDVIIIGAGIGGLTCGCYLAKAGMKVLIVEQHNKVGGYCTSFKRNRFVFNILTSSLGNLGKGKSFRDIVNQLEIDKKVDFTRFDPSDTIQMSDCVVAVHNDFNKTIEELQEKFPREAKAIMNFFHFIQTINSVQLYHRLKDKTLKDLLDTYFSDRRLRSVLIMMLCRLGLRPAEASAVTAITHFREFIFDLGYHPKGGMQVLSNAFAERFKEFGGEILLSHLVDKVTLLNSRIDGVNIKRVGHIRSKFVVAACDPTEVFLNLVGENCIEKDFIIKLNNLRPSVSGFILYLGLNRKLSTTIKPTYVLSYSNRDNLDHYDPRDEKYLNDKELNIPMHFIFPSVCDEKLAPKNKESMALTVFVPFINDKFWKDKKQEFVGKLINRAKDVLPDIEKEIVTTETVTPFDLYKYTLNRGGSAHGWAAVPSQIDRLIMPQKSLIEGLFLCGQWVTYSTGEAGLPMAAYIGSSTARLILAKKRQII